jgi:acyl-CoA synthetase (AMP-forming)/AMP-acid ligase II
MGGKAVLRLDKSALEQGRVVPSSDGPTYVGCGRVTKAEARLRIVDPATFRPVEPGQVGEIWVDSPTKGAGYWGMEEQSRETFKAQIAGDEDSTEYLRTGDLGFLHNEELFITGRCKDLIIVRGRNLYPTDLEASVRDCHPLVRPGGLASFAVDTDAGEGLVMFVEARQDKLTAAQADEVIESVRRRLYEDHQIACHAVVLGRSGTVLKTTSGKVRRLACRQAFINGDVEKAPTTIRVSVQAHDHSNQDSKTELAVGEAL